MSFDLPSETEQHDLPMDVIDYHQRTKHRFDGYAKGPDTIDWDLQPDSFRRFEGAPLVQLPLLTFAADEACWFEGVNLNSVLTADPITPVAATLQTLAAWLQHSLALSAWKQYGSARWSLRCNPSSGNLHPTEAYLIALGIEGLADGLYHYRADLHALEQRCKFNSERSTSPQLWVGLSSVHWREAWKYGERAYRYSQLDIGHAIAALGYGVVLNGWTLQFQVTDHSELDQLLGLDRADDFVAGEEEWADCLFEVKLNAEDETQAVSELQSLARQGQWAGQAAVLDRRHFYQWPVIDEVANLVKRSHQPADSARYQNDQTWPEPLAGEYRETLSKAIRQRRSAQAFDGYTSITAQQFFVMLDHLLPRPDVVPWSALPGEAVIHPVFFVHRVEGLEPGLYAFPRTASGETLLRQQLREQFIWQKPEGTPAHLPLYQLILAKAGKTAAKLSCQQAIAADSAFSLAMLAEFESQITDAPWRYPQLYWEAGALGQQLYLEAESIGISGTGIGCFFDDPVHELQGIDGLALQSLYHFTVGGALHDNRIISLPPYSNR